MQTHPVLWLAVMAIALCAALSAAPAVRAQDLSGGVDRFLENDPQEPWQITADEIRYDDRAKRYEAQGNVRISRGDRQLTADYVRFDHRTMDAVAQGHVVLMAGGDLLIGDRIEINLAKQIGSIRQGTLFLSKNHFYIQGDKIEKLGSREYAIEKASLSSCDGEKPAWKITGRKLDVEIEGQGIVKHAVLWVRDVPVLYTPFFIYPASTQRQSGFLMPDFGASSRKGNRFVLPFYWAINEQSDLTLFNDYMSKRGNKIGGEYRYVVDPFTEGAAMYDYLKDDKIDDGEGSNSDDYGYPDDNYLRRNDTRYWFRMKHDQGLPFGFRGRMDLDLVSDQDYLTEFRYGLTGFEETRDYFRNEFGRDLDDFNDPVRSNQAVINKNWYHSALNGGIVWLDDSTKQRDDDLPSFDTTLQRLPFILWDAAQQPIGTTPAQISAKTEWTSFYSDENTKGLRFDVYPRAYWPFSLGDYVYIEPSAGIRQTAWFIDRYQSIDADQQQALEDQVGRPLPEESAKDKSQYRTLYDLRLDTSTEFSGIYEIGRTALDAVRHTVRPRVVWDYIPNDDQDKYPAFVSQTEDGDPVLLDDGVNRIDAQNLVTYSITNTFTSRYRHGGREDPAADGAAETQRGYGFNDFMRLKFEQSFNIRTARSDRNRPFSPIRAELELFPRQYLQLKAETAFDTYDQNLVKRDLLLKLKSSRGDEFKVDYRYDKRDFDFSGNERLDSNVQSLSAGARVKLPYHLTAYGTTEYDLRAERRIESIVGLVYEAQCWSLDINYNDSENDSRAIAFRVTLRGLGGLGFSQDVGPGGE
jgi:LPS-assembly protein